MKWNIFGSKKEPKKLPKVKVMALKPMAAKKARTKKARKKAGPCPHCGCTNDTTQYTVWYKAHGYTILACGYVTKDGGVYSPCKRDPEGNNLMGRKLMSLALPPDLKNKIIRLAKEQDSSPNAVARDLLISAVKEDEMSTTSKKCPCCKESAEDKGGALRCGYANDSHHFHGCNDFHKLEPGHLNFKNSFRTRVSPDHNYYQCPDCGCDKLFSYSLSTPGYANSGSFLCGYAFKISSEYVGRPDVAQHLDCTEPCNKPQKGKDEDWMDLEITELRDLLKQSHLVMEKQVETFKAATERIQKLEDP